MGWVLLLFGLGALGLTIWGTARADRTRIKRQGEAWALVAKNFGLKFTPQPPYMELVDEEHNGPRIKGACDGFEIDVYRTFTVRGLEASLGLASREPTGLLDLLSVPLRDPELDAGDPAFDEHVVVRSYLEVPTFAALDRSTREVIKHAMSFGMKVVNGELVCGIGSLSSANELIERIELALDLARRMSLLTPEIPGRLLSLARDDPAPRVRTRALASLIASYPDAPETAQACAYVGLEQVEPMLLAHLQERSQGQAVVFTALGAIGSLSAVEPLLQLDCDRHCERTRGAAIAKIQKRLGVGEGGGLSLAHDAPESGGLSTAEFESGQLRIAEGGQEEP